MMNYRSDTTFTYDQHSLDFILDHLTPGKAISFCAPSGTGKTTFLCQIIQKLLSKNNPFSSHDIFVLKMSHHAIDINTQGKDCQKYRDLNVDVFVSNNIEEARLCLEQKQQQQKICLVEGGRRLELPCIVLYREGAHDPNWQSPHQKHILCRLQL